MSSADNITTTYTNHNTTIPSTENNMERAFKKKRTLVDEIDSKNNYNMTKSFQLKPYSMKRLFHDELD